MTAVCDDCGRTFDSSRGLKIHRNATHESSKAYTDPEKLREMYHERGLSMAGVAEELDTTKDRIAYWMEKHGIESRRSYAQQQFASLRVDKEGYPLWRVFHDGDYMRVAVHRLLAVAEFGFDAVVGMDIHHRNGVRWDNRPENIEPLSRSEHRRLHGKEQADERRALMSRLRADGKLNGGGEA